MNPLERREEDTHGNAHRGSVFGDAPRGVVNRPLAGAPAVASRRLTND
jgi:hypothetical protein